jgi:hypothetical protein
MKYTLTFSLSVGSLVTETNLSILDRNKNPLPMDIKKQSSDLWLVTVEITMPNKVFILLTGKDYSVDTTEKFFELKGMSLGEIRFNNKNLSNLFEYKADSGTAHNPSLTLDDYLKFDSDKTTDWDRNGCVILELFDKDPIRYHLHIETQGLATIFH